MNSQIWISISFFIFITFSYKIFKNLISSALSKKIQDIKKEVVDAKKYRDEASTILREANRLIRNLEKTKNDIATESLSQIQNKICKEEKSLKIEILRLHKSFEIEIESKTNQAIENATNKVVDKINSRVLEHIEQNKKNLLSPEEFLKKLNIN